MDFFACVVTTGVTEDNNVPGDLKRNLGQMRELDQQAQELFERMQRLSKNHISKTKKAVQDGREPDEDFLGKARKVYRELMDVDEEKALLIDQVGAGQPRRRSLRIPPSPTAPAPYCTPHPPTPPSVTSGPARLPAPSQRPEAIAACSARTSARACPTALPSPPPWWPLRAFGPCAGRAPRPCR